MAEAYEGTIGCDGAQRPIVVTVARAGEAGGAVRSAILCPGPTAGITGSCAAAGLAVAVGRFLCESGMAMVGASPIRRIGRWTVAGRLDAVGTGEFDRLRVEARKRPMQTFQVTIDGHVYEVTVEEAGRAAPPPRVGRPPRTVKPGVAKAGESHGGERAVRAPMPGKILTVNVGEADTVGTGTVLLVLEAMKMENDVLATVEGTVKTVCVRPGETVNTGDVMVVIE